MRVATYEITGEIWRYTGEAAWHFVTLPDDVADEIRVRFEDEHRPFGSVKVDVTLGGSTWSTSIFRDTKRGSYLLPIKADARRREGVGEGDVVTLAIAVGRA